MSNAPHAELPRSADLIRFAEQRVVLEGVVPLERLSRFAGALEFPVEAGTVCEAMLEFDQDGERRRLVNGRIRAEVRVQCQRCMNAMPVTLESEFHLGLVTSDRQAQNLPRELEPFLVDELSADLWTLVEDELLLVLPPFPLHERDQCPASDEVAALEPGASGSDDDESSESEERENPFSVLADLKPTRH